MSLWCDDFHCGWNDLSCFDDPTLQSKYFREIMESRENSPTQESKSPIERKSLFFERIFSRPAKPPGEGKNNATYHNPMDDYSNIEPLKLKGYNLPKQILDRDLAADIRNLIPARLQLQDDWLLVYSLDHDGVLLNTLYRHCDPKYDPHSASKRTEVGFGNQVVSSMIGSNHQISRPQGFVLVLRDELNQVFGCYLNEHLRPVESKRYYGNGECFLWKLERVSQHSHQTRFKAFMYTGINDNIIYSNTQFIAVGSLNGQNGLYIDQSLDDGISYRCETFGNEVLNEADEAVKMGRFKIYGLEIWRIG